MAYRSKHINGGMFGDSNGDRDAWETPQELFNEWDKAYNFDLDAAASPSNAKCRRYYTREDDGLRQPWFGTVWCNPPYGRGLEDWFRKAIAEQARGVTSVFLVHAKTDTAWFHDFVLPHATRIEFLRRRVRFLHPSYRAKNPYQGSMVVVFEGHKNGRKQRKAGYPYRR